MVYLSELIVKKTAIIILNLYNLIYKPNFSYIIINSIFLKSEIIDPISKLKNYQTHYQSCLFYINLFYTY